MSYNSGCRTTGCQKKLKRYWSRIKELFKEPALSVSLSVAGVNEYSDEMEEALRLSSVSENVPAEIEQANLAHGETRMRSTWKHGAHSRVSCLVSLCNFKQDALTDHGIALKIKEIRGDCIKLKRNRILTLIFLFTFLLSVRQLCHCLSVPREELTF